MLLASEPSGRDHGRAGSRGPLPACCKQRQGQAQSASFTQQNTFAVRFKQGQALHTSRAEGALGLLGLVVHHGVDDRLQAGGSQTLVGGIGDLAGRPWGPEGSIGASMPLAKRMLSPAQPGYSTRQNPSGVSVRLWQAPAPNHGQGRFGQRRLSLALATGEAQGGQRLGWLSRTDPPLGLVFHHGPEPPLPGGSVRTRVSSIW